MIDLSDHLYNPPGCVGWWRFKDNLSVEDRTGVYGAGSFVGSTKPQFATSGIFPFLLDEDGSVCRPMSFPGIAGCKVSIPAPAAANPSLKGPFFAAMMWCAFANVSHYHGLVAKTTSNFPAPFDSFVNQTSGTIGVLVNGNGVNSYLLATSAATVPLNTLLHLAFVYDAQSFNMYYYFNGVLVDTQIPTTTGTIAPADNGDAINIGGRSDDLSFMEGYIDDVRIFASNTRAISGAEVNAVYSSAFAPLPLADMPFGTGGPIGLPSWLYRL